MLLDFYSTCEPNDASICMCHLCVCLEFISLKMGNVSTSPKESLLPHILNEGSDHIYEPMGKRKILFYCNKVQAKYLLGPPQGVRQGHLRTP